MDKRQSNMIKGCAILFMIFHHLFGNIERISYYSLSGLIVDKNTTVAIALDLKVCVALFALMTGYGLVKTYNTNNIQRTYVRDLTIKRYIYLLKEPILILLIALVGTSMFKLEPSLEKIWDNIWFGIITNAIGLAGFIDVPWFISSWWYMSVAICFIFIFPIAYAILKKIGPVSLLFMVCFILPYLFKINILNDGFWRYVPSFVVGMVMAEYNVFEKLESYADKPFKLAMAVLVACILYWGATWIKDSFELINITQMVMASMLSVVIFMLFSKISAVSKILSLLGKYSKGMWLIHVFVYGRFMDFFYGMKNIWIIFGVIVIISLILAISIDLILRFEELLRHKMITILTQKEMK